MSGFEDHSDEDDLLASLGVLRVTQEQVNERVNESIEAQNEI